MVVPDPPPQYIRKRRRKIHRLPLAPQGPQDLGPRPPWRRLSIIRLVARGLRALTRRSGWSALALGLRNGWSAFALSLLAAGALAGVWFGVTAIYQHFSTRTLTLCVLTDFEYRLERPDWQSSTKLLFQGVNQMFRGTGVQWRVVNGGDAYSMETQGDMVGRANLLEESSCPADVVLGLTGRPDRHTNSVALPFSHALLVQDTAASSQAMTLTAVTTSLAELFGVPISTRALVFADAPGGIFDSAAVRVISSTRNYDFAHGIAGLSGRAEKRAVSALADALAGKDPHPEAEAHRIVARAFTHARQYENAARQLREAVRLDPQNASLHFEYAMVLESNSQSDEAMAELKTAASLEPADARPHASAGVILLNGRRVDEAVDEFRIATQLDRHNASYQAALGQALSQAPGRIREASAAFEEAMRLKPTEPGALTGLTRENGVEQTLLQAVRQMETDVNQKPTSAAGHLKLGLVHAYAGDADAARREFQRALELDPHNADAHLALARLNYLGGQYQEAKSELDKARAAGAKPGAGLAEAIQRKLGGGAQGAR